LGGWMFSFAEVEVPTEPEPPVEQTSGWPESLRPPRSHTNDPRASPVRLSAVHPSPEVSICLPTRSARPGPCPHHEPSDHPAPERADHPRRGHPAPEDWPGGAGERWGPEHDRGAKWPYSLLRTPQAAPFPSGGGLLSMKVTQELLWRGHPSPGAAPRRRRHRHVSRRVTTPSSIT